MSIVEFIILLVVVSLLFSLVRMVMNGQVTQAIVLFIIGLLIYKAVFGLDLNEDVVNITH